MVSLGKMRHHRASMQNNIIARKVIACSKNNSVLDFFLFFCLLAVKIKLMVPPLVLKSPSYLISF